MSLTCTRCESTGFINISQVDDATLKLFDEIGDHGIILAWIDEHENHDVQVCDCCGDGEGWYSTPGEHYNSEDPSWRIWPLCI